jgi:hypothetical protein
MGRLRRCKMPGIGCNPAQPRLLKKMEDSQGGDSGRWIGPSGLERLKEIAEAENLARKRDGVRDPHFNHAQPAIHRNLRLTETLSA